MKKSINYMAAIVLVSAALTSCDAETKETKETVVIEKEVPVKEEKVEVKEEKEEGLNVKIDANDDGKVGVSVDGTVKDD